MQIYLKLDENGNIRGHEFHRTNEHTFLSTESSIFDHTIQAYAFKVVDNKMIALTEAEKINHPLRIENKLILIREKRNELLKECDWTLGPDSPLSEEQKGLWKKYRQRLRDFPANVMDVDLIKWPAKPK